MTVSAHRNLAAACRAAELPGGAVLDRDRGLFLVKSGTSEGRYYELRAEGIGGWLVISCTPCPTSKRQQTAGVMACKHRALVAERLEREGLVEFDGEKWRVTDRAEQLVEAVNATSGALGLNEIGVFTGDLGYDQPLMPVIGTCLDCGQERDISTSLICVGCADRRNRVEDELRQNNELAADEDRGDW